MNLDPAVGIEGIPNGSFAENCWLIWDSSSMQAAVVDPGEDTELILKRISSLRLNVEAIWLTHAHIDHIWGLEEVRAATGASVWLHPDDSRWYDTLPQQGSMFGVRGLEKPSPPEHELADGDELSLGRLRFAVRHTPGHAPGHVAFIGHGLCISGDVLFMDSIGRTDLAGGDHATLLHSISTELMKLPDDTRVLTGHGPETTIGRERKNNPFLVNSN